jgi:hypothetical protein
MVAADGGEVRSVMPSQSADEGVAVLPTYLTILVAVSMVESGWSMVSLKAVRSPARQSGPVALVPEPRSMGVRLAARFLCATILPD